MEFYLVPSLSLLSPKLCDLDDVVSHNSGFYFLQAGHAVHNNVCQSAIQVAASDGRWRLGGMEFIKKVDVINTQFLETTRGLRHEAAVAPEEKTAR